MAVVWTKKVKVLICDDCMDEVSSCDFCGASFKLADQIDCVKTKQVFKHLCSKCVKRGCQSGQMGRT